MSHTTQVDGFVYNFKSYFCRVMRIAVFLFNEDDVGNSNRISSSLVLLHFHAGCYTATRANKKTYF